MVEENRGGTIAWNMAIKLKMKVVDMVTNVKYRKYSMHCLSVKGTLRRRLSYGYFSFIAKYASNWLMSHRFHPQIFTFKGAGPNVLAWRGEIWSMLW